MTLSHRGICVTFFACVAVLRQLDLRRSREVTPLYFSKLTQVVCSWTNTSLLFGQVTNVFGNRVVQVSARLDF
jgi:hypothetical protein